MNQQPNAKPEKPIVELLQDIHVQRNPHSRRGVVNPLLVDRITFFASCIFLLVAAVGVISIIWNAADWYFTLRWMASVAVGVVALRIFRALNEQVD